MRLSISLVFVRSTEFVRILKRLSFKGRLLDKCIVFFFRPCASLNMTYSPIEKRIPFCRNIYVKRVT